MFTTILRRLWTSGHVKWVAVIFVLAAVLRIAWVAYVNTDPFEPGMIGGLFGGRADAVFYYGSAQSLAAGDGFLNPLSGRHSALLGPGYPFALASLVAVFGSHLIVAKLFNVFLGAATAVLVYVLATRIRDQRTGIVAGVLTALFPSQVFFSTVLMTEVFFVALSAALVVLLLMWVVEKERLAVWQVMAVGLLVGFMSLVRVEAVLLGPAVVVLWKLSGRRWGEVLRFAPLLLVGMVVVIGPWTARNYARFDEFILVRSSSDTPVRALRAGLDPHYGERLTSRFWREASPPIGDSLVHYGTHPWEVFTRFGSKLDDLFGHDDDFRWMQGFYDPPPLSPRQETLWRNVGNGYYVAVGLVVLAGVPLWFSARDKRLLIVLWFVITWSLIHLIFIPTARYHYPVIPMMCVLAAIVLMAVWDRVATVRAPPASAMAAKKT